MCVGGSEGAPSFVGAGLIYSSPSLIPGYRGNTVTMCPCVYDHHPPVLASNSRVYGEQELPLVSPHPTGADPLHQLRVLVDEPSLAEDVGGGVFQLRERKEKVVAVVVVKDVFVASRPRRTET